MQTGTAKKIRLNLGLPARAGANLGARLSGMRGQSKPLSVRIDTSLLVPCEVRRASASLVGIQRQAFSLAESLRPQLQQTAEFQRNLVSRFEGLEKIQLVSEAQLRSMRQLAKAMNSAAAPYINMQREGERKKAELKERYILNQGASMGVVRHRKWHRYFPGLKPLELMTEDEFDKNIMARFSAVIPHVNILHLFCYVAKLGISRESIGALTIRETAQYLDQLEDEFDEFDTWIKQCDAESIGRTAAASKRGKISRNGPLIAKLAEDAIHFADQGISCFVAAGLALDRLNVIFADIGSSIIGENVFYTSADNSRKSAQTLIEREMKKLQKG